MHKWPYPHESHSGQNLHSRYLLHNTSPPPLGISAGWEPLATLNTDQLPININLDSWFLSPRNPPGLPRIATTGRQTGTGSGRKQSVFSIISSLQHHQVLGRKQERLAPQTQKWSSWTSRFRQTAMRLRMSTGARQWSHGPSDTVRGSSGDCFKAYQGKSLSPSPISQSDSPAKACQTNGLLQPVAGNFAVGYFAIRKFCRKEISSQGNFAVRTFRRRKFRPKDILQYVNLVVK